MARPKMENPADRLTVTESRGGVDVRMQVAAIANVVGGAVVEHVNAVMVGMRHGDQSDHIEAALEHLEHASAALDSFLDEWDAAYPPPVNDPGPFD
jgi:hypothetical protein